MLLHNSGSILHVLFSLKRGGAETLVLDLIKQQSKNGKVELLVVNDEINQDFLDEFSLYGRVILLKRSKNYLSTIMALIRSNFFVLIKRYKVVHCHNHNLYPFILLAFFSRKILTIHTTGITSRFFCFYAKLVCVSHQVYNGLTGGCKNKAVVIENGVNHEDFSNIPFTDRTDDLFKMVQVSRLVHEIKGQDILIDALAKLVLEGYTYLRLDIIGEGPSREFLERIVFDKKLSGYVYFLGEMNRKQVHHHMLGCDLLVQPSRVEGFGLTIVEGMMAKIPVLVSDEPSPMKIINYGDLGYFFRSSSSSELAEAIKSIISERDSRLFKIKLHEAYQRACDSYGIEKMVQNYQSLYGIK